MNYNVVMPAAVVFVVSLLFAACGSGYTLTQFEKTPQMGVISAAPVQSKGLAEDELEIIEVGLALAEKQGRISDVALYNEISNHLKNKKEIRFCQYEYLTSLEEQIRKHVGHISDVVRITSDSIVYLIESSDGPKLFYVPPPLGEYDTHSIGTLFSFNK